MSEHERVMQAGGQSGSHARPACSGERMQVLGPSYLVPGVSAGVPHLDGSQRNVATR